MSTREIQKSAPSSSSGTVVLDHYVEAEDFRGQRPSLSVVVQVVRDLAKEKRIFLAGAALV
jgi:hypothetical protein